MSSKRVPKPVEFPSADSNGHRYVVGTHDSSGRGLGDTTVHVMKITCPLCGETHLHGYDPDWGRDQGCRVPHCAPTPEAPIQYHLVWDMNLAPVLRGRGNR